MTVTSTRQPELGEASDPAELLIREARAACDRSYEAVDRASSRASSPSIRQSSKSQIRCPYTDWGCGRPLRELLSVESPTWPTSDNTVN